MLGQGLSTGTPLSTASCTKADAVEVANCVRGKLIALLRVYLHNRTLSIAISGE